jgi:hypothetical protein
MISPSRSSHLIAAMHHAALTALAASANGQLHLYQSKPPAKPLKWLEKYFVDERFAKLESVATHPPHVLVSAKVLLQSRRAKGGFSFGVEACYA